jgi:hypothetical protein
MRFRSTVSTAIFCLAATLSPYAIAQSGSLEFETNVPFEFLVGKKLFPAGTYKIIRNTTQNTVLQLDGGGKHLVALPILTRLARLPGSFIKTSLVFDVIDNQNFLAEVWMPEVDGYQVSTTSQNHKHAFVEVKE